jgi:hypothetical protein
MPIRPFKSIPRDLVEWGRFFEKTAVIPTDDSVGEDQLQDGEVTFRKIQDVSAERLLGRYPATPGQVQEVSVGGGLEFFGSSVQRTALTGDITANAGADVTSFRQFSALSVLGRSANSAGDPAEIVAAANSHYLKRESDVLGFGAIDDADIPATIARQSTGNYTATLTGCATSPTITVRYVITGQTVTLYLPSVNATSNATSCTLTGAPVAIRPTRDQGFIPVLVQDNGVSVVGLARMLTTGTIDLRPGAPFSATGWTGSGTKGTDHINLTYNLD